MCIREQRDPITWTTLRDLPLLKPCPGPTPPPPSPSPPSPTLQLVAKRHTRMVCTCNSTIGPCPGLLRSNCCVGLEGTSLLSASLAWVQRIAHTLHYSPLFPTIPRRYPICVGESVWTFLLGLVQNSVQGPMIVFADIYIYIYIPD